MSFSSPVRIGIDCRFAAVHAGLGTYTRELVAQLLLRDSAFLYTLFVRSLDEPWIASLPRQPERVVVAPFRHYSFAEQVYFPHIIRASGVDVLFSPQFNVPLFCPVPFVCTVHDLILHKYPNNASLLKRLAYRLLMRSSLRRAQTILVSSETTRRDLLALYGEKYSKKITVVYPGIHTRFRRVESLSASRIAATYGIVQRFILYVGNAKQHKNVQTLIDAFDRLHPPNVALYVIVTGPEKSALRLPSSVHVLSDIRHDDLPALYSAASGFATASLYEGFGLPPLEAMACGCPALVSTCDALVEVSANHAIVAEPTIEGMTEGLRTLLQQSPGSDAKATMWAQGFLWERAAKQVEEVLRLNRQGLAEGNGEVER